MNIIKHTTVSSWVDEYGDMLFRYARKRVPDRESAEDLVQDTFVAALKSGDHFEGHSSPSTWLVGILKHKILDYYRKKNYAANKNTTSAGDVEAYFDESGKWRDVVQKWPVNPEQLLSQKEFLHALSRCVAQLGDNQRRVFSFKTLDSMSSEEICQILGLSSTNLWVILHRARMNLRKCLEGSWFSPEIPTK